MRAFLGFSVTDLGRRLFPVAFAQDAAGAAELDSGSPTGGFALACAFPPARITEQLYLRHESVGQALEFHGVDSLGGSAHSRTVPMTILPYELFEGAETLWYAIMAKRRQRPIANCAGETRAELVWEVPLAIALGLRRMVLLDTSDDKNAVHSTAHGRSRSPLLNPILQKRAICQALSDARVATTWTSTFFQPPDLGNRLCKGDALSGVVVMRLSIAERMVLVGGWAGRRICDGLACDGRKVVVSWTAAAGKKYDLGSRRSQGALEPLRSSGHRIGAIWTCAAAKTTEGHKTGKAAQRNPTPKRTRRGVTAGSPTPHRR